MFISMAASCLRLKVEGIHFRDGHSNQIYDAMPKHDDYNYHQCDSVSILDHCFLNWNFRSDKVMLNSLVNPLIYFSRRSEMRKFVFIKRKQLVTP